MYPLVYHLGVDDYIPNEDFEPHLFAHMPAWQRPRRQPSLGHRFGSLLLRLVRSVWRVRTPHGMRTVARTDLSRGPGRLVASGHGRADP